MSDRVIGKPCLSPIHQNRAWKTTHL